jgi:hypothetical protein
MAEWLKALVLKTSVAFCVTVGSNPTPSAGLLKAKYWGGARVDDWGRLLSGCSGNAEPQVRILSSPHDKT